MLFPLAVALVAVSIGAWLAIGVHDGADNLRPIRLVALVAALATIALHLLPEALRGLGVIALVGVLAGVGLPWAIKRAITALSNNALDAAHRGKAAALEASYFGLVVHRFGDGVSMGAYSGSGRDGLARVGVILALALHIVPVTTVMILAVDEENGRRSAILHAVGLAASTVAGVVAAARVLAIARQDWAPWVSSVVAGLLLHIVLHEARGAILRA